MSKDKKLKHLASTIFLEDLKVGLERSISKKIGEAEIKMFAEISTDHNPLHLDLEYAQKTMFKGRIAHGMLTASLISAVIGEQLPGHGSIYLHQDLNFLSPVRIGDTVEATVSVQNIELKTRKVTLDCSCRVETTEVIKGEALVLAPRRHP